MIPDDARGRGLTWDDLRGWDPAALDAAGDDLRRRQDGLLRLADVLATMAGPAGWTGDAADAAAARRRTLTERLEDVVAEVAAVRRAVLDSVGGVRGVERAVLAAQAFADAHGLAVGADGAVRDVAGAGQVLPDRAAAAVVRALRQQRAEECADLVRQAFALAAGVDADLSAVLQAVLGGACSGLDAWSLADAAAEGDAAGALHLEPPGGPAGTAPAALNAAWWEGLTGAEKERVLAEHPEWIGNRDGVDAGYRDRANRALLPRYRGDVEARLRAVEAELAGLPPRGSGVRAAALREQREALLDEQASLDTLDAVLARPDRHLLALDLSHPRAQAAVAVGDVATADHVAVFTPGLTSTVQGIEGYDRDMEQLARRSTQTLTYHGSRETVATVTWLGYQAPQWGTTFAHDSVASSASARDGGHALAEFYRGLDASRTAAARPAADLTALGHSYGSTTTGYALRETTGVDRAAFFGSPGLGADRADQLAVPAGASWYQEARADPVGDLSRFGTDPSSMAGMGQMWTGDAVGTDGSTLHRVAGHTAYLDDRSTSQYNLAALVAGHPEDVIRNPDPDPFLHQ